MSFWKRKRESASDVHRLAFLQKGGEDFLYLEQFKALRAKFEYKADLENCRVVAVTSAIAAEGKTVTCINLAKHLAASGRKKILLIDVDLRKADLARSMGIVSVPGLTEYFSGTAKVEEIIRNADVTGLRVIPAGESISAPFDVIAGNMFRSLLSKLREYFEIILLDTPPLIPVADTIHLREQVDGFLFIYRVGFTPHPMLRQAVDEVGEQNVIGVVLNGVEPFQEKYYQRYYGKYYKQSN